MFNASCQIGGLQFDFGDINVGFVESRGASPKALAGAPSILDYYLTFQQHGPSITVTYSSFGLQSIYASSAVTAADPLSIEQSSASIGFKYRVTVLPNSVNRSLIGVTGNFGMNSASSSSTGVTTDASAWGFLNGAYGAKTSFLGQQQVFGSDPLETGNVLGSVLGAGGWIDINTSIEVRSETFAGGFAGGGYAAATYDAVWSTTFTTLDQTVVPEPESWELLCFGLGVLLLAATLRRARRAVPRSSA